MVAVAGADGSVCQPHPDSTACAAGYYRPPIPDCVQAWVACAACPPSPAGALPVASAAGFSPDVSCQYLCPAGTCLVNGTCTPAPPGAYATASRACVPCPPGQYMPLSGATACRACPPLATAAGGAVFCACPAGTVLSVTAGSWAANCSACGPGTYANGTSACAPCAAGTVWVAPWLVETCAPGAFRPTPASACQPCPADTFSNASEQSACAPCAAGLCANGSATRCGPCPVQAGVAPAPCTAAYSVRNGTQCRCAAGTYGDGYSADCVPCAVPSQCVCPMDTWFDAASGACRACRTCPTFASLRARCLPGSTVDSVACSCPADHYYHAPAGDCFPCSDCSPQATRVQGCTVGATRDATLCVCNAGYAGNGVTCVCAALSYQRADGSCAPCAACSPNATRLAYCAAGSTADTTACGPCLFGTSGDGFTCR